MFSTRKGEIVGDMFEPRSERRRSRWCSCRVGSICVKNVSDEILIDDSLLSMLETHNGGDAGGLPVDGNEAD